MEKHADVDELLALGARHASQDDALIGEATHANAPGSQSRVLNRALRNDT